MLLGETWDASCQCRMAEGVSERQVPLVASGGVRLAIGRVKWNWLP